MFFFFWASTAKDPDHIWQSVQVESDPDVFGWGPFPSCQLPSCQKRRTRGVATRGMEGRGRRRRDCLNCLNQARAGRQRCTVTAHLPWRARGGARRGALRPLTGVPR